MSDMGDLFAGQPAAPVRPEPTVADATAGRKRAQTGKGKGKKPEPTAIRDFIRQHNTENPTPPPTAKAEEVISTPLDALRQALRLTASQTTEKPREYRMPPIPPGLERALESLAGAYTRLYVSSYCDPDILAAPWSEVQGEAWEIGGMEHGQALGAMEEASRCLELMGVTYPATLAADARNIELYVKVSREWRDTHSNDTRYPPFWRLWCDLATAELRDRNTDAARDLVKLADELRACEDGRK